MEQSACVYAHFQVLLSCGFHVSPWIRWEVKQKTKTPQDQCHNSVINTFNKPTGVFSIKKRLKWCDEQKQRTCVWNEGSCANSGKAGQWKSCRTTSAFVVIYQQAESSGKDIDPRYLLCASPPSGAVEKEKNMLSRCYSHTHTNTIKYFIYLFQFGI